MIVSKWQEFDWQSQWNGSIYRLTPSFVVVDKMYDFASWNFFSISPLSGDPNRCLWSMKIRANVIIIFWSNQIKPPVWFWCWVALIFPMKTIPSVWKICFSVFYMLCCLPTNLLCSLLLLLLWWCRYPRVKVSCCWWREGKEHIHTYIQMFNDNHSLFFTVN